MTRQLTGGTVILPALTQYSVTTKAQVTPPSVRGSRTRRVAAFLTDSAAVDGVFDPDPGSGEAVPDGGAEIEGTPRWAGVPDALLLFLPDRFFG